MSHDFAAVVDPIILYVLQLLDRISKIEDLDPEVLNRRLRSMLDEAERKLPARQQEWFLARFALVAWIDEELSTRAPWEHRSYWANHTLQFHYEGRQDGREEFFRRADEACRLPRKDAIEVFFMCVVLQFKGVYDETPGLPLPADIELPSGARVPPRIEDWMRTMREWISARQPPPIDNRPRPGMHEAPPLEGKYQMLAMTLLCATALAASAFVGLLLYRPAMLRL
jgi:type VI secretion system protein ImpK